MQVNGHDVRFKKLKDERVELYLDGEFEGVFDTKDLAIEYIETLESA